MKPRVFVAVPIHRAWAHESEDYFHAHLRAAKNWELHTLFRLYEESLIQRARHRCLEEFLKTKADYLFFLDDDIVMINDAIGLLVGTDTHLIGGPYIHKKPPHLPTFKPLTAGDYNLRDKTSPIAVKYIASGCMLIDRDCAADLKKEYKYPFNCFEFEGEYLSEDWAFCQNASNLGYQCRIHPGVVLGHLGIYAFGMNDYYALHNKGVQNV